MLFQIVIGNVIEHGSCTVSVCIILCTSFREMVCRTKDIINVSGKFAYIVPWPESVVVDVARGGLL